MVGRVLFGERLVKVCCMSLWGVGGLHPEVDKARGWPASGESARGGGGANGRAAGAEGGMRGSGDGEGRGKIERDGGRKSGGRVGQRCGSERARRVGENGRVTETVIWRPRVRMGMSYVIRSSVVGFAGAQALTGWTSFERIGPPRTSCAQCRFKGIEGLHTSVK